MQTLQFIDMQGNQLYVSTSYLEDSGNGLAVRFSGFLRVLRVLRAHSKSASQLRRHVCEKSFAKVDSGWTLEPSKFSVGPALHGQKITGAKIGILLVLVLLAHWRFGD